MTSFSRDELLGLAAAYATGSTTPDELHALTIAMAKDAELRTEVARHQDVVSALLSAHAVAPTDLVRHRLLTQARVDVHRDNATTQVLPDATRNATATRKNRVARYAALAAGAMIVLGLGAEVIRLRERIAGQTAFAESIQRQLATSEATMSRLLLAETNLTLAQLKTADTVRGPGVQVFFDRQKGTAVVHAFRFPEAPAGYRYQLWVTTIGPAREVVRFSIDRFGHALVGDVMMPANLEKEATMSVTVEPEAGSAQPTTGAVVRGSVRGT
jgi:anti-sigma-K factor RskA